eukprot:CAMPEP_0206561348 /NCGR_PEP_ID=MMETSP0325_2-20121206/21555_1 /ASSEMBLY_ACC=CAM_ASM_000347 /TAXON_ID=2866 /ORGANISM="Crypthecodinium cohnii, Strain Seligo" /LENGTH=219 /DNA_ID=CAMNT_0054063261 /DNA_START=94 /DNA_END=753 /DNA_ORIENTATION=+
MAPEKRIDPEDGCVYTYDELVAHYKGLYDKKAIQANWEPCTVSKEHDDSLTASPSSCTDPSGNDSSDSESDRPTDGPSDSGDEEDPLGLAYKWNGLRSAHKPNAPPPGRIEDEEEEEVPRPRCGYRTKEEPGGWVGCQAKLRAPPTPYVPPTIPAQPSTSHGNPPDLPSPAQGAFEPEAEPSAHAGEPYPLSAEVEEFAEECYRMQAERRRREAESIIL